MGRILYRKSDRLLANTRTEIIRDKMSEIHWNAQLISIFTTILVIQ